MKDGDITAYEDEMFEEVLGPKKFSYIQGWGAGPKPQTSSPNPGVLQMLEHQVQKDSRHADEATKWQGDIQTNRDATSTERIQAKSTRGQCFQQQKL